MATGIPARLSARELRRFGVTLAVPFTLLAAFGAWRGPGLALAVLGGVAAMLVAAALAAPRLLRPVHSAWMGLSNGLGWLNTRLLLGLVYFLIMTPTGALLRLVGHDPLDCRLGDRRSYWVERKGGLDPRRAMELHF